MGRERRRKILGGERKEFFASGFEGKKRTYPPPICSEQ